MAELLVIRHAQASFGADNYDLLSELGHRQSQAVGAALRSA
ncbi:histidine phosphatase family protein, partial [Cribrihabitans sp. XS_ASV171]